MTRPYVIAACGMQAEMHIARGEGVRPVCAGARAERLRKLLRAELAEKGGARGLVSFGIAGGLDPLLAPGALVIGRRVMGGGACWDADAGWRQSLEQMLPPATLADVAGFDEITATASAKEQLRVSSGAAAVDTESHIVAEIATSAGLPFAVIRAVADPAHAALPSAAMAGLLPDGRADVPGVVAALLRDPAQLPALVKTALAARLALRSLRRFRRNLGPGLGCPYVVELMLDVT